ncbi:MAG: PorP/SprF family type IX secretion system membrane protein [Chitinophagales bacterium]
MNRLHSFVLAIGLMLLAQAGLAQQSIISSHFFLHESYFNPAFAGARPYSQLTTTYRNQWSNFNGSPETFIIGGNYSFIENHGIGGTFYFDKMGGAYSQVGGQFSYAYHQPVHTNGSLGVGMSASFNVFQGNYADLDLTDPVFQVGSESRFSPDIGIGVHYSVNDFHVGASFQNIAESRILDEGLTQSENRLARRFGFQMSYDAQLSDDFSLHPRLNARSIFKTPFQAEVAVLAKIKDIVSPGIMYRTGDAVSLLLGLDVTPASIFYSYDLTTSQASGYTGGTHEISLSVAIGKKDSDGDGVPDKVDECPEEIGFKQNNGCPMEDRDGDGVPDNEDDCPDMFGVAKNNGCPNLAMLYILNNQGDIVKVITDQGDASFAIDTIYLNGGYYFLVQSPDNKSIDPITLIIVNPDGSQTTYKAYMTPEGYYVINGLNLGSNVPSSSEETREEVDLNDTEQAIVNEAFGSLEFETGKAIIKNSSYPGLVKLTELLKNNPDWKVSLTGHTDNVGDASTNMILSKRRAEAVRDLLESFGANASQIVTDFKGETDPIDNNNTPEGRERNRRVDIVIYR